MLAEAPFSASPELNAGIKPRLDQAVEIAREVLGDALRSVVLGGSLARGRALGVDDGGELRLLSDFDLYFVTAGRRDAAPLRRRLEHWAAGDVFFATPPDVAVIPVEYFVEARTAMPTHQLAHANRLLWGRPVPIAAARGSDGSARVDPDDAARLLFNRCVEALDPALRDPRSLPALMHRTKQFIDAPMAWLAARGHYSPDRREQVRALTALVNDWDGRARVRMDGATRHWTGCLDARDRGFVERLTLEQLAGRGGGELEGGSRWEDWTGGFTIALMEGTGLDALRATLAASLDHARLLAAARRWRTREALPARLRLARRWCSVAPPGVTPWWRHGGGGAGPDRIHAAAALRAHSVEEWSAPLRGMLRAPLAEPGDLHALWWRWIQGRDDET